MRAATGSGPDGPGDRSAQARSGLDRGLLAPARRSIGAGILSRRTNRALRKGDPMTAPATPRLSQVLDPEHRGRLMRLARDVSFPQGARIFEAGARADHFWIVRSGNVALEMKPHELDASTVRLMCRSDPALGSTVGQWVGLVLAHRLHAARTRLLDLYTPYGSGPVH